MNFIPALKERKVSFDSAFTAIIMHWSGREGRGEKYFPVQNYNFNINPPFEFFYQVEINY